MKIVVLGAGAVGGYFGAHLARAGLDVTLVARGAHLAAIRDRGLTIASPSGEFTARPPATDAPSGAFDLALLAVKAYDTESTAHAWAPHAREVASIQNGLGNEEKLVAILGAERVFGGISYVAAEMTAPGRIEQTTGGWLIVGEMDGRVTPRVKALREAFARAEVKCEVSTNIVQVKWEKLLANAVFNCIAAAYGVELGELLKPPHESRVSKAIDELVAVARAEGVEIRAEWRERAFEFCRRWPTFKSSTQQDVARGRRIEYEALNGEVVRRGRARGIATPTHEELYARLRALSASPRAR